MTNDLIIHIADSKITNTAAVRKFFTGILDGKYRVSAKRINKRSTMQNAYYWVVVVGMIRDRMIELGNDVDSDLVHIFLKDRFNGIEIQAKDGVNIGTIGGTTTKLSKYDFEMYLEKIKQFASEVLDLYIPDPNTSPAMEPHRNGLENVQRYEKRQSD